MAIQKTKGKPQVQTQNRIHSLEGFADGRVRLNGYILDIKRSQKVHNHSADFSWGFPGSGPSQLALAIILEITGNSLGYQEFKWAYLTDLPQGKPFKIIFSDHDIKKITKR